MTGTAFESRADRLLTIGVRRPRLTLAITLALVILSALAMTRLHADGSVGAMLGDANPSAVAMSRVLDRFSAAEDLIVLAEVPESPSTGDAGARAAQLLAFAERLNATLQSGPSQSLVRRVYWAPPPQLMEYMTTHMIPAGMYFLDESGVGAALERLSLVEMRRQIAQDEAMIATPGPAGAALGAALIRDPLRLREFLAARFAPLRAGLRTYSGGPEFISEDARAILIRIAGAKPPSDLEFAKSLTDAVKTGVRDSAPGALRIALTGSYAIAAESARAIRADLISNTVWSTVLMGVLFLFMYRSPFSFPVAMLPVVAGILCAFGLHTLTASGLTPLIAVIGSMLAGLGIDYGIHLLSHIEAARADGRSLTEACSLSLRSLAWPLVMGCATSIAGFVALFASDIHALREFALVGCVGLLFVLAAAITALPAVLALLPSRVARTSLVGVRISLEPLVRWNQIHARAGIIGTALVAAGAAAVVFLTPGPWVRLEDDLRVMHPAPNAALATQDRVGQIFGISPGSLLVHISAPNDDALATSARRVGAALASERALRLGVAGTIGLDSLVPDPGATAARASRLRQVDADEVLRNFRTALDESSFDPTSRPFSEYNSFLRRLLSNTAPPTVSTLRDLPELSESVLIRAEPGRSPESEAICTVLLTHDLSTGEARALAVETIRDLLRGIPDVTLTGMPVLGYDAERLLRSDLPRILGVGLVIVLVMLAAHYRRTRDVALVLVPLGFSMLCLLAWLKLSGGGFNMINQMALPILCGIAVDYGIFLVSLGLESTREGVDPRELLRRVGASSHAIFMAAWTTILGMGTLGSTSVPAIQSLGDTLCVGMVAAWACTQFLLAPVVLMLAARRRRY